MPRMKKILIASVVVAAALVAGLGVLLATLDLNAYKAEVTQRFAAATGRELHIDGGIELGLSLAPSIFVEEVRIANAAWGTAPDMLQVARAEAQLALLPLLTGNMELRRLALFSPTILIENDARDVSNWDFGAETASQKQGGSGGAWRAAGLDELEIRDAVVAMHDHLTGETTSINIAEATLDTNGAGTPLKAKIVANVDGQAIRVDGTLGKSGQILANQAIDVDLDVAIGAATLAVEGSVARPLQGEGLDLGLELRSASLADLGRLAGADWPTVGPVEMSGRLADTDRGHALNGLRLRLADSELSGKLQLEREAGRHRVTGRLYAERIDLASLQADGEKTPGPRRLFPNSPLPLAALAALDADIALDARRVDAVHVPVENLETRLVIDHGRLRLEPFTGELAGGRMNAVATLEVGEDTARAKLDLAILQLEPSRLPALKDAVTGAPTDVTFEAEGEGASVAAIMASLDGRLLVQSGEGTLNNRQATAASSDLLLETYALLDPTAQRDTRSRLSCSVFHFAIDDGVAITDRGIALATNRMNVIGSGIVNLETEGLDIRITTQAREGAGLSAGQFADLVRLGGTLSDPQPGLDTGAAVMTGVSAGAAVATSGLSILAQSLYDRLTADDAPCETALAMRIEDTRSPSDKAADAVKGVGDAIKGAFESLFGN